MIFSLTQRQFSSPDQALMYDTKDVEQLGEFDVRVRLIYAPINPADMNMIEGQYIFQPEHPCVVGNEAVGEVIEVGSAVSSYQVGDRVIHPFQSAQSWVGFWRSSWCIHQDDCLKVPDYVSDEQASMLSINPITVYLMLTQFVNLKSEDWIIQNCANSGVGRWVIFLARKFGLRTVNIVRHESQVAELLALGADDVIVQHDRFSSAVSQKVISN